MLTGQIYVIENENHRVKIGKSTNPKTRIMNIQSQSGYKIINSYFSPVLYQYDDLEIFLHKKFKDKRVRGEWFDVNYKDVISFISSIDLENWNITPTKEEQEKANNFIKDIVYDLNECLQNCINRTRIIGVDEINEKLGDIEAISDKISERNMVVKKYIENLYDQIDVLHSKLIYLQEQGVEIKFPKLPQYEEGNIILAREGIIEEYKSIE